MGEKDVIKALEWLVFNFPKQENPKDDSDRLCNCINLFCRNAVDFIKQQQAEIERLKEIANPKCQQCVEQTRKNSFVEFAERLCDGRVSNDPVVIAVKTELKLTEGGNGE